MLMHADDKSATARTNAAPVPQREKKGPAERAGDRSLEVLK
jgi:hypothetical protein